MSDNDSGDNNDDVAADSCQKRQHDHDSGSAGRRPPLVKGGGRGGIDWSQLELRYRAEGNANLVLALPQFRKVWRLPKASIPQGGEREGERGQRLQSTSGAKRMRMDEQEEEEKDQKNEKKEDREKKKGQERDQEDEKVKDRGMNQERDHEMDREKDLDEDQEDSRSCVATGSPRRRRRNPFASREDLSIADYVDYIGVLRRLVGSEFILEAEVVEIPDESRRKWINETIRSQRPAHRLDKEFCGQFGLVLPDATLLPEKLLDCILSSPSQATPTFTSGDAFAIEIKPKQGWRLPSSDVNDLFRVKPFDATITTGTGKTMTTTTIIPTTTRETMTTTTKCSGIQEATRCRYCTMQFLKLRNRKIARRSFYCPIELFSGQPDRMLAALSALLECPQNNLRIFRNGDLIYGDHSSSISWVELKEQLFKGDMLQIVQQLLVASLLRDFSGVDVDSAVGVGGTADEATRGGRDGPSVDNEAVVGQPQPQFSGGNAKNKQEENVQEKKEDKKGFEKEEKKQKVVKHIDEEEEEYEEVAENELQDHLQRSSWRKEVGTQQITEARGQRLPKNCVLQKVLHLQLLALHNSTAMASHNSSKTTARTTAETMMTSTTKTYRALKDLLSGHGSSDQVGQDLLQYLPPAQQYLLGATALDCSVMIAFQEVIGDRSSSMNPKTTIDPHLVHLDEFNRTFLVKVSLLDLDPKPDGHFEKYVRQTQEAYRCLQESLELELEPGQCGR